MESKESPLQLISNLQFEATQAILDTNHPDGICELPDEVLRVFATQLSVELRVTLATALLLRERGIEYLDLTAEERDNALAVKVYLDSLEKYVLTLIQKHSEKNSTLSIESECPQMLRFVRNGLTGHGWKCVLIQMKRIKHLTLPAAYVEPPPCTIPPDEHSCCCECDGCTDYIVNPYVECHGRKRMFSYPKKDRRCQLVACSPDQDQRLEHKFGAAGEKLINHAGTNTIVVCDSSGRERKTIRCAEEHFQTGTMKKVGCPPKREFVLRCEEVEPPPVPPAHLWKIIDRVTGRVEYMFSSRS